MPVTKSWQRPWICKNGHCRKDEVGTAVYVLQCDNCNKTISVTTHGPADLEVETGWFIKDHDHCYCKECKR